MKAIVISMVIALALPSMSKAQTEKGRWTVGAQAGNFTYQKQQNDYRTLTGNLTPSAGYFVANGLAVGTGVPLGFSSTKYGQAYTNFFNLRQIGSSVGLAPFVRYYLGAGKLKPFVGMAYSYIRTTSKYKTDTAGGSESKIKGYTTALVPSVGLVYFINSTLGLAINADYNINHVEYNTVQTSPYTPGPSRADYDSKSLSLGIGFQLFLGR